VPSINGKARLQRSGEEKNENSGKSAGHERARKKEDLRGKKR